MKKLLSIVLAIAIIAAMLPSVFAADPFEGYEYVFKLEAIGSQASDGYRSKLAVMTLDTPLPSVSDKWKVAASRFLYNVRAQTEGIIWNGDKSYATGGNSMFAIEIWVPTGGTYKPSLSYSAIQSAPIVDIYLVKEGTEAGGCYPSDFQFVTSGDGDAKTSTFIRALGDDYKLGHIDMWGGTTPKDYGNIVTENFNDIALQLDGNSKYYLCFHTVGSNTDKFVATDNNTYYNVNLESFSLSYVPSVADTAFDYEKEDYVAKETAQVSALAAYGSADAITDSEVISVTNVAYGENCTVSVKEETVTKGEKTYKFSHWARGAATGANRMVLSSESSFSYKPSEGNNILIAVFEEEGAEKKEAFYNYNGQLLSDLKIENNKLPSLPSMAGFENPATKWVQMETGEEFDAGADVSEISGNLEFIAKYDAPKSDIKITVNGEEKTYAYGENVECVANVPSGKVFMYWTKTVAGKADADIVSLNESYSFSAWEDSVVTAVYGDAKPSFVKEMRKVIISSVAAGNETAIMAEFIGFDDASEKGIMIGNQKIAMTTDKTQFTVVNDTEETEICGYAIVGNATDGYEQITDK